MQPTDRPSTMKELREAARGRLDAVITSIEQAYEDAKTPGSPLNRELSVRSGRRRAETLLNRARDLTQIADPAPHITHPTRERVRQAGEDPRVTVVLDAAGQPSAVSHKWVWPVERLQRAHLLKPAHYLAAARFYRAFEDQSKKPGTMSYGDGGRVVDPTKRNPITNGDDDRQTEGETMAGREVRFVLRRLEDELKAIVWVLVLQQKLPGDEMPLSPAQFGRRFGQKKNDDAARAFADGALWLALRRLSSVYQHFDVMVAKERGDQPAHDVLAREVDQEIAGRRNRRIA